MKILEVIISSIFVLLILRLLLQSRNTTGVLGSLFQGSTQVINAVVPATLN